MSTVGYGYYGTYCNVGCCTDNKNKAWHGYILAPPADHYKGKFPASIVGPEPLNIGITGRWVSKTWNEILELRV